MEADGATISKESGSVAGAQMLCMNREVVGSNSNTLTARPPPWGRSARCWTSACWARAPSLSKRTKNFHPLHACQEHSAIR